MTTLYIVRHAFAGQHGDPSWPDDSLRPLTDKGRKQFRRVVKKLVRSREGFVPKLVATSPYVRCRQTAELVCDRVIPPPELVEVEALEPGSRLDVLVGWSNERGADELAWVGHAPDVDRLTAALIGTREGALRFAKGAVAALRFEGTIAAGRGELAWFVSPKVLK